MMIQRCTNPKNKSYKYYGARGISVCARWFVFANFAQDMGQAPLDHTLGRKDNNGPYSKENCVWETYAKQNTDFCFRVRD